MRTVKLLPFTQPANAVMLAETAQTAVNYGTTEQQARALYTGSLRSFYINTFTGASHMINATWSIPGYDGNTPGWYLAVPEYSLPEGVINPLNVQPAKYICVKHPNGDTEHFPFESEHLACIEQVETIVEVTGVYKAAELKSLIRSRCNRVWVLTKTGYLQYTADFANTDWSNIHLPGTHTITVGLQPFRTPLRLNMPESFIIKIINNG